MFSPGDTIKETIEAIQKHQYVLPAIQREYVWKPEQIAKLFDSLMQGYPVGTLLLWRVEAANAEKYNFYDFVRAYHERDNPHCEPLPVQRSDLTAVLDGQQRLTAMNIGLTGSLSLKDKYKRKNNANAYPARKLYLNLIHEQIADEEGAIYRFEFLTQAQIAAADTETNCWFCVADILSMESGPDMMEWLNAQLPQEKTNTAYRALDRLHRVIHTEKSIAYFEEKSQELTRVLNIFIRMNSGGTVLSYSDLLLSIAVAQWKKLNAREEIHGLVDDLNKIGDGFSLSKDLVLKAGLVLTDIGNVGFKVENFDATNMQKLEDNWERVGRALRLTVQLFSSFGYNSQNLRATSVLLPVAYYLCQRDPGERYLTTNAYEADRKRVRLWVAKSLLKTSGIWGSGLDTLLTSLRDTIRQDGQEGFPAASLESQMARRGKSLQFDEEELEEILDSSYGKSGTFALMSFLFSFVDLQNHHHLDHVFPQSGFKTSKLKAAGLSQGEIEQARECMNHVANLQLLEGHANIEKQAMLPGKWLGDRHPDEAARQNYIDNHLLSDQLDDWQQFLSFYEARRTALHKKLKELLSAPVTNNEGA